MQYLFIYLFISLTDIEHDSFLFMYHLHMCKSCKFTLPTNRLHICSHVGKLLKVKKYIN